MRIYQEPTAPVMPILPILDGEIVAIDLDALAPAPVQPLRLPSPVVVPVEPKRSLIRRLIDDPYWILVSLAVGLGLSIVGTIVYGVIEIVLAIRDFLANYGVTIAGGGLIVIVLVLLLAGGTAAATCGGLHCPGCGK